ncbi:hypothetical protein GCM10020370_60790 [Paenibacillus hodogayensis]
MPLPFSLACNNKLLDFTVLFIKSKTCTKQYALFIYFIICINTVNNRLINHFIENFKDEEPFNVKASKIKLYV